MSDAVPTTASTADCTPTPPAELSVEVVRTIPHDPEASMYGPVTDWATDFDHADPDYNRHAHEIWADLRATCPVAHTDRYGGTWLPVTHADVTRVAYDTEHFTSRSVVVSKIFAGLTSR